MTSWVLFFLWLAIYDKVYGITPKNKGSVFKGGREPDRGTGIPGHGKYTGTDLESKKFGTFETKYEVNGQYYEYKIEWNKADIAEIQKQVHPETHSYVSDGQERLGLLKEGFESVFRKEIVARERKALTGWYLSMLMLLACSL